MSNLCNAAAVAAATSPSLPPAPLARIWIRSLATATSSATTRKSTTLSSTTVAVGLATTASTEDVSDAHLSQANTDTTNNFKYEPSMFGKSMFDALKVLAQSQVEEAKTSPSSDNYDDDDHHDYHYDRQWVQLWEDGDETGTSVKDNTLEPLQDQATTSTATIPENEYRVLLEPALAQSSPALAAPPQQAKEDLAHPTRRKQRQGYIIPMGRARAFAAWGATACPTTMKPYTPNLNPKKPFTQLAVVGLVLDSTGRHVLLTRRPSYMRSFPGAWVLPGGGWDAATDDSLADALQREVWEETGLQLYQDKDNADFDTEAATTPAASKAQEPICLWESVFPTDPAHPGPIKAHHLVVFHRAFVKAPQKQSAIDDTASSPKSTTSRLPPLKLQTSEVDSALWLSVEDFCKVMERMKQLGGPAPVAPEGIHRNDKDIGTDHKNQTDDDTSSLLPPLPSVTVYMANGTTQEISLDTLVGIYPQRERHNCPPQPPAPHQHPSSSDQQPPKQQQQWCGIAQGSFFALEELLLHQQLEKKTSASTTTGISCTAADGPSSWATSRV